MTETKPSLYPGLAVTLVLAILARMLQSLPFPPFTIEGGRHPIDAILLAIVLGMVVRNTITPPRWLGPGVAFSVKSVLPFAIVLMGAKLDFYDVVRVSGQALVVNVVCVVVALIGTIWLCHRMGLARNLGLLIGVGTAICGGTAIALSAPVLEAKDDETALAVTVINVLGLAAIVAFPVLGGLLQLDQMQFGVWAGTAVHATPQVMAAGFAYGEQAGEIAVIVKLVRVLLLAPLLVGLGWWVAREKRRQQEAYVGKRAQLTALFPPFIVGFVLVALANTANLLPDFTLHLQQSFLWEAGSVDIAMATVATESSSFLITMAMAGVGLGVHLRGLAKVGLRALQVGLFAAVLLAGFSLALLMLLM